MGWGEQVDSSSAFFLLLQTWTGYSLQACLKALTLWLLFVIILGTFITSLLNKMYYLLVLISPTVYLLPHFLLILLKQFLQMYSVNQCMEYFKRERLRSASSNHLSSTYLVICVGTEPKIGNQFQFRIVMVCSPDLLTLMLHILQSEAFLITNLKRLSFFFFGNF